MNNYIVIFSIGPVQSMIASARRSRDLWGGSWLLSELAKAGANYLYEKSGCELIFPFINDVENLNPNSDFSVGNKLQAIIQADNPQALNLIINETKQAIHYRFIQEAENALSQINQNDIRIDIWKEQINDFVEIQSAWALIKDDKYKEASESVKNDEYNEYKEASELVGKVLASRKSTRDFKLGASNPYEPTLMIPKSSLDGLRETVLCENTEKQSNSTRKKLSLTKSEQLDAVGVIKRLGFDNKAEQFTPFTRICADAWIEKLIKDKIDLSKIKECYEDLIRLGVATRVRGNHSAYQDFAYDAQYLYESRIDAELNQWQGSDDAVCDVLKELKAQLKPIWREYGQPQTYGVLLQADGDRMGELLDKATTKEQHQEITKSLSKFAGEVANVMREYKGHCIYAGGDDVLGFVPLDKAYECAEKLRQLFANSLNEVADNLNVEKKPTLSVGLAICHIMTPLGVIRELAQKAEKIAKGLDNIPNEERRNALGILLSVRGGSDIDIRMRWDNECSHQFFKEAIGLYENKKIPSRVAYDIRAIFLRTKDMAKNDDELRKNIQSAELVRMLKQARTNKGEKIDESIIEKLKNRGESIGVDKLADKLIIARWLAAKTLKDLGKE